MNGHHQPRSAFWDEVKGVCIVAVVVIHVLAPLSASPAFSADWISGTLLLQPVDFAVPMFLAVSGYFARNIDGRPLVFYLKRARRLVWPYVVWTVIYLSLFEPSKLLSPVAVLLALASGTGIGIGYFVVVLSQFILLTPILSHLQTERQHLALMAIGACFGLAWSYAVRLLPNGGVLGTFPADALPFFVWCPFYQLGFYLSRFPHQVDRLWKRRRHLGSLLPFCLLLSMIEAWAFGSTVHPDFGASQIKLSSFIFSALLFLWLVALSVSYRFFIRSATLKWLGSASFPIYLSHMLVLRLLLLLLSNLSLPEFDLVAEAPFLITAVLALCACAIRAVQQTFPVQMRAALSI
jgi:fucose 4-O-acetylase-like acetyltransferase